MEKSSIDRIIGRSDKKTRENAATRYEKLFLEPDIDPDNFIEKGPKEEEIIKLANKFTNDFLAKYGIAEQVIPSNNIHFVDAEKFLASASERTKHDKGEYSFEKQAIAVLRDSSDFATLKTTIHEILHFRSYTVLQLDEWFIGKFGQTRYRMGMALTSRTRYERYFHFLEEAIISELTERVLRNAESELTSYKEDEREREEILAFSYAPQRKIFKELLEKLFTNNMGKFSDAEQIFNLFGEASTTGNMLPIGKLIDRTFGKGTFRKLGVASEDTEKFQSFVESLPDGQGK